MSAIRKRHPKPRTLKETPSVHYNIKRAKAQERQLSQATELDREIQKHVGKWVAIADGRVVSVGDTVQAVMTLARQRGFEAPIVVRGPLAAGETLYVFAA